MYQQDDFLIRPLGSLTTTPARRISYQHSPGSAAVHKAVYREHDFRLIDVPADQVDKRAPVIMLRSVFGQVGDLAERLRRASLAPRAGSCSWARPGHSRAAWAARSSNDLASSCSRRAAGR